MSSDKSNITTFFQPSTDQEKKARQETISVLLDLEKLREPLEQQKKHLNKLLVEVKQALAEVTGDLERYGPMFRTLKNSAAQEWIKTSEGRIKEYNTNIEDLNKLLAETEENLKGIHDKLDPTVRTSLS